MLREEVRVDEIDAYLVSVIYLDRWRILIRLGGILGFCALSLLPTLAPSAVAPEYRDLFIGSSPVAIILRLFFAVLAVTMLAAWGSPAIARLSRRREFVVVGPRGISLPYAGLIPWSCIEWEFDEGQASGKRGVYPRAGYFAFVPPGSTIGLVLKRDAPQPRPSPLQRYFLSGLPWSEPNRIEVMLVGTGVSPQTALAAIAQYAPPEQAVA